MERARADLRQEEDLLLPPGTRLLHIGPHKTGTTAIQFALHDLREDLRTHGVHYAGNRNRPRRAGWAIGLGGYPSGSPEHPVKHWHYLVDDVAAAGDLRVVVSNEDFARADADQVRTIVDGLGGGRPHVLAFARRLDRYLPSQWQERVKAGSTRSYDDWLRTVLEDPDTLDPALAERHGAAWERENVWFAHDTEALVRRWAAVVGVGNLTLVLLDERDRGQLNRTFERMLGLPEGYLPLVPSRTNRSLSWAEVELVLAVNRLLHAQGVTRRERRRHFTPIVRDLSHREPPEGPRVPPLPRWADTLVKDISRRRVEAIRALGVRVVGDVESLAGDDGSPVADAPAVPPTVDGATAAAAVASGVRLALERERPERPPAEAD
jgi:hypothetical protein